VGKEITRVCTHLHGCTDACAVPVMCGCGSIVTVFFAWSCDMSWKTCGWEDHVSRRLQGDAANTDGTDHGAKEDQKLNAGPV
jgi:hypothetical protein